MKQKNTSSKRTIALISLILLNGLFLSVLLLPLSETATLMILITMIILLILWISFALGGLPSVARSLSLLLFFASLGVVYTSLLLIPSLNALVASSGFQSFFTMVLTAVVLITHFPKRVKQAVERWLHQRNPLESDTKSVNSDDQSGMDDENSPISYTLYRQRRFQEILRSKPTSMLNANPTLGILRLIVFILLFVGGVTLVWIGSGALPIKPILSSVFVWMMVGGLGLLLVSLFVIFEGFVSALKNGALIFPVLVLLTLALERVFSLYDHSLSAFMIAMSLVLLTLGILLFQWIKAITLGYTIALMMFKRGEVWLGVEQLFKESLPIEHYDQLTVVEIKVDEQFDLTELMFLGPKLERYAHVRRIIFAGLCFDPSDQNVQLYFCCKNQAVSDQRLSRFFKRHFHYPFSLTHLQDPKAILEARLTPTQDEVIEANNRNTVFHYEDEGIDLTQLHHIILILTFKDEASTKQAHLDLSLEGYSQTMITDTRRQNELPASEDNGWFVLSVQSETRLGLDRVNILTRQINQIIQPTQGRLNYWVLGKFQESDQVTLTQAE